MSGVIARRITATPVRTSSEAWEVITKLLAPDDASAAREILGRASGVACSAIASEAVAADPIVVWGSGPRVRIYCLYDENALSGEDANEGDLPETATEGDWRMSIAVSEDDFEWSAKAIKACAPHISVRKPGEDVEDEDDGEEQPEARQTMRINLENFLKR